MLAAVSHPSATFTDAVSTALLVLGPDGLESLARRYPETDLLVVSAEGGRLDAYSAGPDLWQLRLENVLPETEGQEKSSSPVKPGE